MVILSLALALAGAPRAAALEFRVVSLVEAHAVRWPAMPAGAAIEADRLSFRRKVCLRPTAALPARDPAVRAELAAALAGLSRADRRRTAKVLEAIGERVAGTIAESAGPPGDPAGWRSAAAVVAGRSGHAWERVRVLVALARAAGIPARPSFNGVPMAVVWADPPRGQGAGFWTVWDPLHPSGSFRRLPVLWLPLGAEEVPPVSLSPRGVACRPLTEGRRYPLLADAAHAFAAVRSTGRFPDVTTEPLSAEAAVWWEVWSIGASLDPDPSVPCTATVPLPYVKELGYGARERAVWLSEPARLKSVSAPLARTDQELGGIRMALEVRLRAAPASATGVPGA